MGEKIQNESVAIETAGITIVRRGKGRVSWKGPQTINAFPYLEKLGAMEGVTDFLCTEFSTSTEKNFPLVEFIDTPGLTDGTLKYPFDVDEVICELAEHATMIMVFLDPIGKALVSRCMVTKPILQPPLPHITSPFLLHIHTRLRRLTRATHSSFHAPRTSWSASRSNIRPR